MRLVISIPSRAVVDGTVAKVVAEAENGWFCLLPRHVDFVTSLVPGILLFETEDGAEQVVAIDEGILLKQGAEVRVSTRNAVRGDDLASLQRIVAEQFLDLDEHERTARGALARLEAGAVRRFRELKEYEP